MVDLREDLNPAQYEAVTTLEGPVLVIAGAGSGKTRVIEYRVLNMVLQGMEPGSILLLTFTRKAAREMIARASRHDPRCKGVAGGTFHSFAYRTLRRFSRSIGFPDGFAILDEGDAEEAIHRVASRLGYYDREKRFPRKDTLRSIISVCLNKNATVGEVVNKDYPHFVEYLAEMETLRDAYAEYKVDKNYLDYDDLLVYLRILLETEEVRERLTRRHRYVMVDEYQDTNAIQGDIAHLLAGGHGNIMAVGDDAQSIYGFRGASHENIMAFPERFPGCRVVTLEDNYRSTQAVLDVANTVLETMTHKYQKCLVSARHETGRAARLVFFKNAYDEAAWAADRIKEQLDEGVPLGQQCVLFRSLYLSIPLQSELGHRNIPYETYGGLKFYETAHVKDLTAHLKVLANPRDELSWNRALMLIERIGPKTAGRITDDVLGASGLGEALELMLARHGKGKAYGEGLERLGAALGAARAEGMDVGDVFDVLLEYYGPLLKNKYDDWHLRRNDLEALRQVAARYGTLEDLLEDFAVEPPERGVWGVEPETKEEEHPLVLSTIHSAKGLEWDSVFLMGMADGVLPVTFSLDSEEDIEEERRLFYVAVTRARNRLTFSMHHEGVRGGITQFNKLSRFLDVPEVLRRLELVDESRAPGGMPHPDEYEEILPLVDKEELLRRLKGFYK
jgi:DNA helicase-2/ATP-dependent DNA helicase PcrA